MAGRPLLFKNKDKLDKRIESYFKECVLKEDIPTISGLAVFLDTSRETLCNYQKKEEYFDTIKGAKDRVVSLQEQLAMKNKINPTVWIFSAKNNLDYVDKKEIVQSGELKVTGFDVSIKE
jgi:hypothetical protein